MNGLSNPRIGGTATDIAGQRAIDILVSRFRVLAQQGHRGHDLTRLAIAALWYLQSLPGLDDRGGDRSGEPFNGPHLAFA